VSEILTATGFSFPQSQSCIAKAVVYQPIVHALHAGSLSSSMMGVAALRRQIATFAKLGPNWDDEGARPIAPETLRRASKVVEHIAIVLERKNTESFPAVLPFPDGSVFFKWVHGSKELNITVDSDGVTAQHWQPLDAYHSLGLWPISVDDTSEHVEWVLT
jgi:hypothetical protein